MNRQNRISSWAIRLPWAGWTWIMQAGWGGILVVGLLAGPLTGQGSGLQEEIDRMIRASASQGAQWGLEVCDLATGNRVLAHEPDRLLVMASNTKLWTVATALDWFGEGFRWRTELRTHGEVDADGVLRGDLQVVGEGDPGWGDRSTQELESMFVPVLEALDRAGIRRIDGELHLLTHRFPAPPYGSGWNWDDLQEAYGAPVSALVAADNAVWVQIRAGDRPGEPASVSTPWVPDLFLWDARVRTVPVGEPTRIRWSRPPGGRWMRVSGQVPAGGRVQERMSVPDGAAWFGALLARTLEGAGRVESGTLRVQVDPEGVREGRWLAGIPSLPVGEWAARCLKPSNNLVAQMLLLQVGRDSSDGEPAEAWEQRGIDRVRRLAARAGVGVGELTMEEGSGLSRKNMATASAIVRLLVFMDRHPAAEVWWRSMPVSGVDGTLRGRLTAEGIRGRVRAKTGTLRHVNALSGVLDTAGGDRWAFSLLVNGYWTEQGGASAVTEMDRIIRRLVVEGAP